MRRPHRSERQLQLSACAAVRVLCSGEEGVRARICMSLYPAKKNAPAWKCSPMLGGNMLSAANPDKLSVLMPEPIRWYGIVALRADPKCAFVARKTADQTRAATVW